MNRPGLSDSMQSGRPGTKLHHTVRLLCLLACCYFPLGSWGTPAAQDALYFAFSKSLQDYLDISGRAEHVTGISAAVWVPGMSAPTMYRVVAGTMGNAPYDEPMREDALFEIGSITKSFTAALLLQLASEGRLSLDDTLGKWLPRYRQWKGIRLRQLLNMTSGIPGYTRNEAFFRQLASNLQAEWSYDELVSYAVLPENSELPIPGQFDYSNTNYILATEVVEAVTHEPFANQLHKRLLGRYLEETFYPAGPQSPEMYAAILARKARGYYFDERHQRAMDITWNNLSWAAGAGGLVSTPGDVLRWVHTLFSGAFVAEGAREQVLRELLDVVSMKTGKPLKRVDEKEPHAFGLGIGYVFDAATRQRYFVYEGGTLGFRVMYLLDPCNRVATAVALNSKTPAVGDDGDNIWQLNMALYQTVLERMPELRCKRPQARCALAEVLNDKSC